MESDEDTDLLKLDSEPELESDSGEPDIQVTAPACTKMCCTDSRIYQPLSGSILKKTEKVYGSGKNARKRHVNPAWFKSYSWLHYCLTSMKVYCHYCKHASLSNLRVMSTKAASVFSVDGFCNWKNATAKLKEHEKSLAHRDAVAAHVASKHVPITQQLQTHLNQSQVSRRESLIKQISALRYLLRQGLAVRNDHAGGSNLTIMMQLVLNEKLWVSENKYQSPEVINELIEIMGHKLLRSLLCDIKSQQWFAMLADETRDISNREQLVLCLRYVTEKYEIYEDMIGLYQLDNTTANTVYSALKDCFLKLGISFANCRGQAYDGAKNFQGHVSGVAKRFQKENAAALPVHCLAHCINLSLQEAAQKVKSVREGLNLAMDVIQLIKLSPKRQVLLENIQSQQASSANSGIRSLCPTRWTVRTGAIQAILNNYGSLQMTMEAASHGTDDCSRRAGGVMAMMDKFFIYFGLKLSFFLFSITEQLSTTLQGKSINVDDCFKAVNLCIRALKRHRTDSSFHSFFEGVKEEASSRCDPPVLPRQRQIPRRLDSGSSQHVFTSVEEYFRKDCYEAIDCITGELERRFCQDNFLLVQKIEGMLLDSANGKDVSIPPKIDQIYKDDINMERLLLYLKMLPDAIKSYSTRILEVTRVQTICDVFNENEGIKSLLTEVHKLLKIFLTIPVTTASAERSFSALKRIKSYLRNSMTQQRLNQCMLLHVHHQKTDDLILTEIAKEFVERNERRQNFFGH